jgi:hypothetical protein
VAVEIRTPLQQRPRAFQLKSQPFKSGKKEMNLELLNSGISEAGRDAFRRQNQLQQPQQSGYCFC